LLPVSHVSPTVHSRYVLVAPAVLTLLLSLCFWSGMKATDDLGYARMAVGLLRGHFIVDSHHAARIGLYFPLAILFGVFGTNSISLGILPILTTVLTAYLVVILGRYFYDAQTGVLAGALFAVFPLTLYLSSTFVPEPILVFETCIAAAIFVYAGHREDAK